MNIKHITISIFTLLILLSCNNKGPEKIDPITEDKIEAKIVSVAHTGSAGNYNFKVGISSPDLGCEQYADWWEVLTESGDLIYRRVLGHSHVNEQPFVRSGGGVDIQAEQIVIVRAHMNTTGYTTQTFKGSVADGFKTFDTTKEFAKAIESEGAQPPACAF